MSLPDFSAIHGTEIYPADIDAAHRRIAELNTVIWMMAFSSPYRRVVLSSEALHEFGDGVKLERTVNLQTGLPVIEAIPLKATEK